jgi:hypothetical protein
MAHNADQYKQALSEALQFAEGVKDRVCAHHLRAAKARARYTDALQDASPIEARAALAVLHTLAYIFPPEQEQQLQTCSIPHAEAAEAGCLK